MYLISHFKSQSIKRKAITKHLGLPEPTKLIVLLNRKYLPGIEKLHSFFELIH